MTTSTTVTTTASMTNPAAGPTVPVGLSLADFRLPAFDLYRDIHKGIRAELFAVTGSAGTLDPTDTVSWIAFAEHVGAVERTLTSHAHHEDSFIDPVLREHVPDLAERVVSDHGQLEASFAVIAEVARAGADAPAPERRRLAHLAYLQLASFTGAYLAHQSVEEVQITPALERTIGPDAMVAIHMAILGSIPPEDMAQSLTMMLPAMNVDDRAELLQGMQATAPPEAFSAVVGLTKSVLAPADVAALADRMVLS